MLTIQVAEFRERVRACDLICPNFKELAQDGRGVNHAGPKIRGVLLCLAQSADETGVGMANSTKLTGNRCGETLNPLRRLDRAALRYR